VSAFAWEPVIAVDQHGTVGVIWYDIRNDRPGDGMTSADANVGGAGDVGLPPRGASVLGVRKPNAGAPIPQQETT
jgi:hypothetical protein